LVIGLSGANCMKESSYIYITQWGSRGYGDGKFEWPCGIAISPEGYIYIVDRDNDCIQEFDSTGNFMGKFGSQRDPENTIFPGQFYAPGGIALDMHGNIYVADSGNDRIQKFDSRHRYIGEWGEHGLNDGQFCHPSGISVDIDEDVYVTDYLIQKFDSDGNFISKLYIEFSRDGAMYHDLGDIEVDSSGNIYVLGVLNSGEEVGDKPAIDDIPWISFVHKCDSSGKLITQWGAHGSEHKWFENAMGIGIDSQDNIFVAETNKNRIQVFDSDGKFITEFGSKGTGNGQFTWPVDVAIDKEGNVYVVDCGNCRIQKFKANPDFKPNYKEDNQ